MINIIISLIQVLSRLLLTLIIVDVLISYILPPYHNVRVTLDRILNPILNPIRKLLPTTGGIDFSPLVLLVLIQVLESLLISIFSTLR
jgi:YggT family protein